MADYLSGQISFAGLGSGTDFQTMIDQLIEVESIQKQRLELWKSEWNAKVEGFQELNTKMLSLKTTMDGMDTLNEFMVKSTNVSNSDVLTATSDSDAEAGTHSVEINQLAQNAVITGSSGFAEKTEVVNSSGGTENFVYTYAGTDHSVSVANSVTLEGLRDLINKDANNPGVRASIISDGDQYYLQLRGLDQGDDNTLTFNAASSTMTNAAFNDAADFEVTQVNQSAQIRVDGWPVADWISVDSNSVDEVIEGVTLNLKDVTSGTPIQVTVNNDTAAIKENIRTFVDQVNEVRSMIKTLTEYDDVEKKGSVLTGNYGIQLISSKLKDATASIGVGFERYNAVTQLGDKISALSQMGIRTDAETASPTNGLLVIDEEELDQALSDYPDEVAEMFAANGIGATATNDFSYSDYVSGITEPGTYDVAYSMDASGNIISGTALIDGQQAIVDNNGKTLTSMLGDSRGIVIRVNNTAQGSYSGEVRLKQGKAGEISDLLSMLTDAQDGPLAILEENYYGIMENIDKKIEREDNRLERMRRTLMDKFSRLDTTLNYYDNLSTSLSNQIGQLVPVS